MKAANLVVGTPIAVLRLSVDDWRQERKDVEAMNSIWIGVAITAGLLIGIWLIYEPMNADEE